MKPFAASSCQRATPSIDTYAVLQAIKPFWIADTTVRNNAPKVVAYRCRFALSVARRLVVNVSADERYEFYVNGSRVGRGPERADLNHWAFESYQVDLPPGDHIVVAKVWSLCDRAPFAQMSLTHGFLCFSNELPDAELLTTGISGWEYKQITGIDWLPSGVAWGCGAKVRIAGDSYPWGIEHGTGDGWQPAVTIARAVTLQANDQPPTWRLQPAQLPAMYERIERVGQARLVAAADAFPFHDDPYQPQPPADLSCHLANEAEHWNQLLLGSSAAIVIAPHTKRRVLIDLGNYFCAYPELITTGGRGAVVRVSWAESMYDRLPIGERREWIGHMSKGQRGDIAGKYFHGVTDEFLPDGGAQRLFTTLWWQAGRYVQLCISTGDEPLTIVDARFRVTHYPFEFSDRFSLPDERYDQVATIARQALLMGTHEHHTDCPYYEQLQYIGDTRLECLTTYVTANDGRLARKAIELLDGSRTVSGMVQSRYPTRVTQHIWGFNLWWIGMVYDYLFWRGDEAFVRERMPGVRRSLEVALAYLTEQSVVVVPLRDTFSFTDWSRGWQNGHPPIGEAASAIFTWQLVHVLGLAVELERHVGEPELAARWQRLANTIAAAATGVFLNRDRGLMADDPAHTHYSEHAQLLAILSAGTSEELRTRLTERLFSATDLSRATIYFTHYVFEAAYRMRRGDVFSSRSQIWFDLLDVGLCTLPEEPEPTRSDCHPWGAHLLYHIYASVLGIRPTEPGMRRVRICPQLGPLPSASGSMPHPAGGRIEVSVIHQAGQLSGRVHLPPGVSGTLEANARICELGPGVTDF